MAKTYQDDNITWIESDIEKIQKKTGMYISYVGSKGALHLAKEVINNAIDECISKKSPGNKVSIFFDEKVNKLYVTDNGRGIPFDKVELVCTKIQAGSKFTRDADKKGIENKAFTAGENGVGITAVNALSREMVFNIYRDGERGIFLFNEGKLVDKKITKVTGKEAKLHGTTVAFIPDEKYLGKCKFDLKELKEWIINISYLIDPSVTLTFSYCKTKSETVVEETFSHDNGIKDLVTNVVSKRLFDPIYLTFKGSYKIDNDKVIFQDDSNPSLGNDIIIQAAFTYNPDIHDDDNSHYITFCNYVNTIDHGVHLNAAKKSWCKAITKLGNESLTENEAKKFQISFDDARNGLYGSVNLMCDNPQFASQTKEKISNDSLFKPIYYIIYVKLMKYFKDNPAVLKKAISYVKSNAKSRLEITKIRKSEYKPVDNLSENTLACFNPANGKGYRELFLVEGKSAKGTLVKARDPESQALFALRGVPKNAYGAKITELLANQEFKYLIKILGCGIGQDFDIKKLKYDKIIIFTDSDIDGFRIASLLCAFFITQYPQIVQAGLLYKAVAPLYIINDPKHPYILNKTDYYEYFADKVIKIVKLYDDKGIVYTPKKFKELIIHNDDYLSALDALVNYYSVHPDIIEFVVQHRVTNKVTGAKFKSMLKKRFPEMSYSDNLVRGVYQGTYQYLDIDDTLTLKSKTLSKLLSDLGNNVFKFDDKGKTFDNVTFGQFMRYVIRYMPVTESRLKGLGEMNDDKMWDSSLNPKTRQLIQLTSDDIERELERFGTLHGKDSDQRKELMKEYVLDIKDLDN